METYRTIADAMAADILAGRLKPGDRLPAQRDFADQRGIAASTASRVYAELVRRGLVSGEVGRGTFVRAPLGAPVPALAEPGFAPIDLELNFPLLPQQGAMMLQSLQSVVRGTTLDEALRPTGAATSPQVRATAAAFLAHGGWGPDPEGILLTGNGKQAIAATFAALARPGDRIGVEALTYPVVKGIAARLGITLVPLRLDDKGLVPDAVLDAHRSAPLRAVYLQPALHNPLGVTMDEGRRHDIAALLEQTDLVAIEDAIYAFLADEAPLARLAPDRVIVVDSLSKRVSPGVTVGFIAAPVHLRERIAGAIRAGAWSAAGLPLAIGVQLIADGTATRIGQLKRDDAAARQAVARTVLADLELSGDARAYHLWLEMPGSLRAESFVAAAYRHGIAVCPGSAFAVGNGHAPNAVRLALSSPPIDTLRSALQTIRQLMDEAVADPG